jgi:hypothetical protein
MAIGYATPGPLSVIYRLTKVWNIALIKKGESACAAASPRLGGPHPQNEIKFSF